MAKRPAKKDWVSEGIRPATKDLIDEAVKLVNKDPGKFQGGRLEPLRRYEVVHMAMQEFIDRHGKGSR